jgi:hypothetical protein
MGKRTRTHCFKGHELTKENTYTVPSTGHRYCKTCKRAAQETTVAKIRSSEGIKAWHRRIRYGVTPEKYQEMLNESDGRCAICQREMEIPPHRPQSHN